MRSLIPSAIAIALSAAAVVAQTVPTGFTVDTLVSSGLQAGHDFTFLPDGRVLIANRGGAVMVYAGGAPVTVGTVPSVETGSERGLLGITVDPAFASNGYLYVWYSSTADAFLHLDRFTCTGDLANASSTLLSFASTSRRVILAAVPDNAFNHNGGSPRFGPDGMLYQTIGDDASACTAQSTTSSLGCVLRMDVSAVPAGGGTTAPTFDSLDPGDNPLSANAGSISQLVIAHGLRNPVRMEIDQATGNLYIGDVGQNAVEEYSEYVRGSTLGLVNFGWPWREGNNTYTTCTGTQPALVAPIAAVAHSGSGWLSAMGGPRYRNQTGGAYNFGAAYEGVAFYLDYFAGQVRAVQNTGSGWAPLPAVPGQPSATNWGSNFVGTVSFRQGPDGAIWFLQHPGTYPTTGGTLKRIRPLGPTNSVVAVSGGGQVGVAGEAFGTPVRVQVRDTSGNALPGGTVNFTVSGGATLSTTNPVVADGNGFAQTNVTATTIGGAITITGSTPGSQTNATFALFARKLTATPSGTLLVMSATNTTTASPANVPYILMASFPGSPILSTSIGPICTDPGYALTVVLEDGTGAFGGVSLSGSGAIGNPNKTWLYTIPAGLLTGYQMKFQAVGLDPVTGWFRTNCEVRQF